MKFFIVLFTLCILGSTGAQAETFNSWLQEFRQRALAQGISQQALDRAFQGVRVDEKVIELDRKQPEGWMTLLEYVERTVSSKRVATGKEKLRQYKTLLLQTEKAYGVPAEILIALWGKETDFGGFTGNSETISSLATLAFEGRRRQFFEKELMNAIQVMAYMNMTPRTMKGSWAGAIGQCQFMPSNYLTYAVDGNRNGKTDLWNEMEDVFPSMANLLRHEGWQAGAGWGQRITMPHGFDKSIIGRDKQAQSVSYWEQRGVRFNQPIPKSAQQAIRLYQPDGPQGPAYALYHNFDVLMRWNRSGYFAVAVGRLADKISMNERL